MINCSKNLVGAESCVTPTFEQSMLIIELQDPWEEKQANFEQSMLINNRTTGPRGEKQANFEQSMLINNRRTRDSGAQGMGDFFC